MISLTAHNRVQLPHASKLYLLGVFLAVLTMVFLPLLHQSQSAHAADSATLNFQARLLNGSGNVVPDGNYHIEFRLYSAATGGTAAWTETRTTGNLVRVVNGYFSVNLGSVTALPTTFDWDQEKWLTMNVGGAGGTATFDGEMNPRIKLTAVPFAFTAGELAKTGGGLRSVLRFAAPTTTNRTITIPDATQATDTVCLQTLANCAGAPADGGDFIVNGMTLQTNANFNIQARDSTTNGTVGAIIRGAAGGQTVDLLQLQSSAGTNVFVVSAAGGITAAGASIFNNTIAVNSGTGVVATFSGRVSGADAVNNNEFVTKSQLDAVAGGVGGGVTSLNTLTGALSLQGTSNQISVASVGTTITLSTPQDIAVTSNVNFASVTTTANIAVGGTLGVTGQSNLNNTRVRTTTNSTTGFVISDTNDAPLFTADTVNRNININQGSLYVTGLGVPVLNTFTAGSNQGGALSGASGTTYYYRISALNSLGESLASTQQSFNGASFTPLTPPGAPTAAVNISPGNLNGAYTYKITFVTANGQTIGGTTSNTVNPLLGQQVNLTNIPLGPAGTTQRNIYRTAAGGADGTQRFVATIANNTTTTFTDNLADGSLGANLPGTNTARTNTNNLSISFTTVPGATSYRIYRYTTSNATTGNFQTTTTSPFTDAGAAGTSGTIPTTAAGSIGIGTNSASASLTVAGNALFQNALDSNAALLVQNAAGARIFGVNSSAGSIEVGQGSSLAGRINLYNTANANFVSLRTGTTSTSFDLVLPVNAGAVNECLKNDAATPGVLVWGMCGGGAANTTLQDAYNNDPDGGDAIIALTTADGAILIRDTAGQLATSFAVQNSAGTLNYLSVAGSGLSVGVASTFNSNVSITGASTFTVGSGATSLGGTLAVSGAATFNANVTVAAGQSISLVGGITSTRPAAPTEGMLYYDQTTRQLLIYANGKWQADRSNSTKIVAASNSSQAVRDSADFVATGTGDQATINAALTAAAGGSVYLAEGTYTVNASIIMPNNTSLTGSGRGSSIELAAINVDDSLIELADTASVTEVVIRDIQLNGRNDINTIGNQNGIRFFSTSVDQTKKGATIENVSAINFRNSGMYIRGLYNSTISHNYLSNNGTSSVHSALHIDNSTHYSVISDNIIANTTGNSIRIESQITTISGNIINNYSMAGILNEGGSNTISGNILRNVTVNNRSGIELVSSNNTVVGNTITGSGHLWGAIYLRSSNFNTISSNNIINSGTNSDNNGIIFSNSNSTNSITSNVITDTSCTTTCHAIVINSTTNNTYLADNRHSGTTANPSTINDLGTGTIYANQLDGTGNQINRNQGGLSVGRTTAGASLDLQGGLRSTALPSPAAPTLTTSGTTGTSTYGYRITALDGLGETLASTETTIATGNATLSATNRVNVNWTQVGGAVQYRIYRTTSTGSPATTGLISTVNANVFTLQDTGLAASGAVPTANTTGAVSVAGAIQGGGALTIAGTTTLNNTLTVNAGTGVVATFSGRVVGADAVNSNEFVTLGQIGTGFIQNGTTLQTNANFNIQARDSGTAGTVGAIIRGAAAGQTVDLLQFQNSSGTTVAAFNATGNLVFNQNGGISGGLQSTANASGFNLTVAAGNANGTTTGNTGGTLALQGGNAAGTGNHNGGNVNIAGGTGIGTGSIGSVNISGNIIGLQTGQIQLSRAAAAQISILTASSVTGNTSPLSIATGVSTGASSITGSINIISGNGTGTNTSSGAVSIDAGTATGTAGGIAIGTTNSPDVTIGRSAGTVGLQGATTVSNTLAFTTLGAASNNTALCRNASNQLATCNNTFATTNDLANYVQFAPASAQADATTNSSVFINKTGASGNLLQLQRNGVNVVTVGNNGIATFLQNTGVATRLFVSNIDSYTTDTTMNIGTSTTGSINIGRNNAANAINLTSGTGGIIFNGNTSVAGGATFSVGSGATTLDGTLTVNGTNFTNAGSSLFTHLDLGNYATGGSIGLATATVDVKTTFNIAQTTTGQTLTLPNPTNLAAGRIVIINNRGTATFLMYGVTLNANTSQTFIWNGNNWTPSSIDGAGAGATQVGQLDLFARNANGGVISNSTLYLQTADGTNPGLVSAGAQSFGGAKTFNAAVTAAASGTGLIVTNDATIGGTLGVSGVATFSSRVILGGTIGSGNAIMDINGTFASSNDTNLFGIRLSPTINPLNGRGAVAQFINPTIVADTGETVSFYKGIELFGASKSGTGTITDAYQLFINSTNIATNNYSLYVAGGNSVFNNGAVAIGQGSVTASSAMLTVDTDPGDNRTALRVFQEDTTHNNTAVYIENAGSGDSLLIRDAALNPRFVVRSNGNVGIGVAAPNANLHVQGSDLYAVSKVKNTSSAEAYAEVRAENNLDNYAALGMGSGGAGSTWNNRGYLYSSASSAGLNIVAAGATADIRFTTGSELAADERMRISSDGGVAIGTTDTSGARLKVINSTNITSGNNAGARVESLALAASNSSAEYIGQVNHMRVSPSSGTTASGRIAATFSYAQNEGAGTISSLNGIIGQVGLTNTGGAGQAAALRLLGSFSQSSGTIGTAYGLIIEQQTQPHVTSAFGIRQLGANDVNEFDGLVRVGTSSAASLSGAKLVTTLAEVTTTLRIGNATNGVEFNGTAPPLYRGTARPTKRIMLTAEYLGAVLDAGSGANNTGSMTSGYSVGDRMNFYKWTTQQTTNQNYDVVVQVPVPADFDGFVPTNALSIAAYTSNTTNGRITMEIRDSNNNIVHNSGCSNQITFNDPNLAGNVTPGATAFWTNQSFAFCSSGGNAATFSANNYMTIRIRMQSPQNGDTRIGNIYLDYFSRF